MVLQRIADIQFRVIARNCCSEQALIIAPSFCSASLKSLDWEIISLNVLQRLEAKHHLNIQSRAANSFENLEIPMQRFPTLRNYSVDADRG